MINNLPPNPAQQRTGAFPHDPFTTNFHSHGLTVSPNGISDNVLRRMEPGTVNAIQIDIPADHLSGTMWYHPHKHGSVSFQFFGGMSGFLIIEGGEGTLDEVPEVKAAQERLMAFQVIRTDQNGVTPYVSSDAVQFSTDSEGNIGIWDAFNDSKYYFTTNGVTNPVIKMSPGEVQRWRMLNAASGETIPVALQNHSLNIIANDGITIPQMLTLDTGEAYVMGAGNRVDVLIKAGEPGIYLLQVLDTSTPRSVTTSGIAPANRRARIGGDFPDISYPVTLATLVVSGDPVDMELPIGPLPVPSSNPSVEQMLNTEPDALRNIAFETCGQGARQEDPDARSPSCGWYTALYDADYWGGISIENLLMMRDADDVGVPNDDSVMPRIDFLKDGLFNRNVPLFDDMVGGNFEEWTVFNRSFSDHPFHIHINPFLLTHINAIPLSVPEWRDTVLVPAATGNDNINLAGGRLSDIPHSP